MAGRSNIQAAACYDRKPGSFFSQLRSAIPTGLEPEICKKKIYFVEATENDHLPRSISSKQFPIPTAIYEK